MLRIESGLTRGLVWKVCTLSGHNDFVISVAFSPDGKFIVSGSFDGVVKIWDAATGAEVSVRLLYVLESKDIPLKWWDEGGWQVSTLAGDSGYLDLTDMNRGCCWQVFCLGEHNGQGICLCTVDEEGYLAMDDDDDNILHPGCPVLGHRKTVHQVEFSDDGLQVVSGGEDNSVRVSEIASTQVRQLAGNVFAFVEGPSDQHTTYRHILTASDDTLLVYQVTKDRQRAGAGAAETPVACFKAPQRIVSVRGHGAAICVGCEDGAVCILRAPFLGV